VAPYLSNWARMLSKYLGEIRSQLVRYTITCAGVNLSKAAKVGAGVAGLFVGPPCVLQWKSSLSGTARKFGSPFSTHSAGSFCTSWDSSLLFGLERTGPFARS
jgi:hypothetical protein